MHKTGKAEERGYYVCVLCQCNVAMCDGLEWGKGGEGASNFCLPNLIPPGHCGTCTQGDFCSSASTCTPDLSSVICTGHTALDRR